MTDERFKQLMADDNLKLTPEEITEGWHFCFEQDGLLVNSTDREGEGQFCDDDCRAIREIYSRRLNHL